MAKKDILTEYLPLLDSIKSRIRRSQVRATLAANGEMLLLYWDVGRIVADRQKTEGWGAGVIPRLAADIRNDMPEVKGFSERNIFRMIRFYQDYPQLTGGGFDESLLEKSIMPQVVAQLQSDSQNLSNLPRPVSQLSTADEIRLEVLQKYAFLLPWGHHVLLIVFGFQMNNCLLLP